MSFQEDLLLRHRPWGASKLRHDLPLTVDAGARVGVTAVTFADPAPRLRQTSVDQAEGALSVFPAREWLILPAGVAAHPDLHKPQAGQNATRVRDGDAGATASQSLASATVMRIAGSCAKTTLFWRGWSMMR